MCNSLLAWQQILQQNNHVTEASKVFKDVQPTCQCEVCVQRWDWQSQSHLHWIHYHHDTCIVQPHHEKHVSDGECHCTQLYQFQFWTNSAQGMDFLKQFYSNTFQHLFKQAIKDKYTNKYYEYFSSFIHKCEAWQKVESSFS